LLSIVIGIKDYEPPLILPYYLSLPKTTDSLSSELYSSESTIERIYSTSDIFLSFGLPSLIFFSPILDLLIYLPNPDNLVAGTIKLFLLTIDSEVDLTLNLF